MNLKKSYEFFLFYISPCFVQIRFWVSSIVAFLNHWNFLLNLIDSVGCQSVKNYVESDNEGNWYEDVNGFDISRVIHKTTRFSHSNFVLFAYQRGFVKHEDEKRDQQWKAKSIEWIVEESSTIAFPSSTLQPVVKFYFNFTNFKLKKRSNETTKKLPKCRPDVVTHDVQP